MRQYAPLLVGVLALAATILAVAAYAARQTGGACEDRYTFFLRTGAKTISRPSGYSPASDGTSRSRPARPSRCA